MLRVSTTGAVVRATVWCTATLTVVVVMATVTSVTVELGPALDMAVCQEGVTVRSETGGHLPVAIHIAIYWSREVWGTSNFTITKV